MLDQYQSIGMRTLLWHLLSDAATYSALVPWMLDSRLQAPSLSVYVQQKQVLQDQQLQVPHVSPHNMRQCVLQTAEQLCRDACELTADTCWEANTGQDSCTCSTSIVDPDKMRCNNSTGCSLSQPALRLAKLHGHILSHGLAPNLAEQLHALVLLLTSAPLQANTSDLGKSVNPGRLCIQASKGRECHSGALDTRGMPEVAAEEESVTKQLVCCRACAAGYAAKALECCSKLLCCLPEDLVCALASSPHIQCYAPALTAQLMKTTSCNGSAATMHRNAAVVGSSTAPTAFEQQQHTPTTPACVAGGNASFPSLAAVSAGPGSAVGSLGIPLGGRPSTGGKAAHLSGLGLLVHNTPGSTGGRSTGGRSYAAKPNNAAVCNREKSRDLFFSILRKCSSRLDALRQQQTAADALDDPQQQATAAAVYTTELQELMAELGLTAKQLLLQLAPGNQTYLAELFTACVLQAASTGEPILDPHLAVMAERDPGKFHKLQQRLGDRISSAGGASPVQAAATAPRPRSAGGTRANAVEAQTSSASILRTGNQSATPNSAPVSQPQRQQSGQAYLQRQQNANVHGGTHEEKRRINPAAQGLAATGLMYRNPSSSHSTGGGAGRSAPTAARQIRPTPSTAGNSTSNSFRLKAATGLETPVPFAAAGAAVQPSPKIPQVQQLLSTMARDSAAATAVVSGELVATPSGQQLQANNKARSLANPAVSRVVQLEVSSSSARTADMPVVDNAPATAAQHRTPASAPAASCRTTGTSAAPAISLLASSSQAATAAAPQQSCNVMVVQQVLAELPPGQHVLLLVLHAADSSSFNSAVLQVLLTRAEQILSGTPTSLSAAGGLGQQAAAVVALAKYCSYLSFVAIAGALSADTGNGVGSKADQQYNSQQHTIQQQPLLQLQPVVDVLGLLRSVNNISRYKNGADAGWCLALTVPFVCGYLQFVGCNSSAAASPCILQVRRQLRVLQSLPCMSASHPSFGSLSACLACCVSPQVSDTGSQDASPADMAKVCATGHQQQQQQGAADDVTGAVADADNNENADMWCSALQQSSQLVDRGYWTVCCPGLQHLWILLSTKSAAAQKQQKQQQQQHTKAAYIATSKNTPQGAGSSPAAKQQVAKTPETAAGDAGQPVAAADGTRGQGSTSPAGSLRHTTPLLLAPREPPVLETLPAAITEVLAEAKDPTKQQLRQAFLGQYSTDDNPVKMRDVLSLVNGVLCANSLSLALCQGVPPVLQKHLDTMSKEVQDELGPVGAPSRQQLHGQELARAVHGICNRHSIPAIHAALESAVQQASQHACEAATAACKALLPVDIPPAAAAAAAALVATSCKASCAQKLLQEVPVLVQSSLADQADELVKLVTRQWAVHNRLTAPAAADGTADKASSDKGRSAAAAELPASSLTSITSSKAPAVRAAAETAPFKSSTPSRAARRISPVLVAEAAASDSSDDTKNSTYQGAVGVQADCSEDTHRPKATSAAADQPPQQQAAADATADIASELILACTTVQQGSHAAEAAEALANMQQEVAAALVQHSLTDAVNSYLAAATRLRPTKALSPITHTSKYSQQQRESRAQQQEVVSGTWGGVVAAAACTAELLVIAVQRQLCSLKDLEQHLASLLNATSGTDVKSTVLSVEGVESQGMKGEAGDAGACKRQSTLSTDVPDEVQDLLYHLLAAAVLHAFASSTAQRSTVWGFKFQGQMPEAEILAEDRVQCGPQQLMMLPALVMKAARCDKPTWFLRQLRLWIQHNTLGGA